jgi:predicted nucleic-acid-binding protein
MQNKTLIDTNVILRFLTMDNETYYRKSCNIFSDIEKGKIKAFIPEFILAETVYVLKRIYNVSKKDIAFALKQLLMIKNINCENKMVVFEALDIYAEKNIDFADSLLCAKMKIENYEIISFDKDLSKC